MTNDRQHTEKIIEIIIRRLWLLEEQRAAYGMNCPPHIILEIEDLRRQIDELKRDSEDQQRIKQKRQ